MVDDLESDNIQSFCEGRQFSASKWQHFVIASLIDGCSTCKLALHPSRDAARQGIHYSSALTSTIVPILLYLPSA